MGICGSKGKGGGKKPAKVEGNAPQSTDVGKKGGDAPNPTNTTLAGDKMICECSSAFL
jgi:hypothetical protein